MSSVVGLIVAHKIPLLPNSINASILTNAIKSLLLVNLVIPFECVLKLAVEVRFN